MSEQIHIQDDSGDKEFFTIIPNYIINHSTAIDRSLYIEMKRFAGEQGKCFATQETMMKRLGIGRKAYNKSLDYLLEHGWISFVGTTQGKTRPIKTYKVNNIWKLNNSHYKQIQAERTVSFRDTGQKNSKIQAERTVEEDLTNKKNIGEDKSSLEYDFIEPTDDSGNTPPPKKYNPHRVYTLFKVNYPRNWKLNRTERTSAENLENERGLEKIKKALEFYHEHKEDPYCPQILKPSDLDRKWEDLLAFKRKL